MRRDFSERSERNLLQIVKQVEDEKLCDFTDWIGDRWYDYQYFIGKLRIKNYLDNVNAYHRKVIDKNNTTKSTIREIFNRVQNIDKTYQGLLLSRKLLLQEAQRYEWYASTLQRMTDDGRYGFYLNLNSYINDINTAETVKKLWLELHS